MSFAKTKKWFDNPLIVGDTRYWKPKSEWWFWLSVFSFFIALTVNIFLPFVEQVRSLPYQIAISSVIVILLILYFFALKRPFFRVKLYYRSQFVFAVAIALTLWDLATAKSGIFPMPFFPSFSQIVDVIVQDRQLLLKSAIYSMRLFFAGLSTGIILGLATGILIGWLRQWDYWLSPIIKITGIIPAVAWIPVALVILPSSFATGIFLIFIASWFPVSSMVASGISATPKVYFELAKTLGADQKFLLFRVALPSAMPSIFMGIMTATAFSFTTLIVSEMIGAEAGLGFYINWAKGWGAYAKVYAAIIIIGIEFSLILALIESVKSHVLRWQRNFK
ncbi:MAG: ABC transporter permease subunit [Elusimicrobiota bacterium]|jgi:NitT/TauT family transport system permease protein|nr:ABC transporter permease subunit [Elusimicrobiota bacterium]